MFHLPKIFLTLSFGATVVIADGALAADKKSDGSGAMDWRQKLGTFRVGIIGGNRPILETRRIQPFRKALQKALGVPVEVFAAKDFSALIDAHINSRVEYAVYSATAFSAAWAMCKCVEPLVAPIAEDGAFGFRSILLSAKNQATSMTALKGKDVLIPGRHSFTGYQIPLHQLALGGVDLENYGWKLVDQKRADKALSQFKQGKAAGLFGWVPEYGSNSNLAHHKTVGTTAQLGKIAKNYKIIWQSSPIPHGPHAIHQNLDRNAKKILKGFLTQLQEKNISAYEAVELNFSGGFKSVDLESYQSVISLVRQSK